MTVISEIVTRANTRLLRYSNSAPVSFPFMIHCDYNYGYKKPKNYFQSNIETPYTVGHCVHRDLWDIVHTWEKGI